jgi:hypothetical protein
MIPFKAPVFEEESFNCPHCNAYSHQIWESIRSHDEQSQSQYAHYNYVTDLKIAWCARCERYSLWLNDKMIYPEESGIRMPNPDLRGDIKDDYNEARSIINRSPRGAVAILRLCIQKLCEQLGQPGKNINDDIAKLVEEGLPPTIQKALDIVRVIGNYAVHPGQIDLKDDVETANKLFELVNLIAQDRITQPREIEQLYEDLPETKRTAIEARDKS